jgi:hypothetical protein
LPKYDNKVRQAVLDRILVDKLNTSTVQKAIKRDFYLVLSTGFLYEGRVWPKKRNHARVQKLEKKAHDVLTKHHLEKLLNYLDAPSLSRSKVRTNHHEESCNRVLRYLQKVRYKWRRRKTIVRHIPL